MNRIRVAVLLAATLAVAPACQALNAPKSGKRSPGGVARTMLGLPIVFADDFESGKTDHWAPTDPKAWKIGGLRRYLSRNAQQKNKTAKTCQANEKNIFSHDYSPAYLTMDYFTLRRGIGKCIMRDTKSVRLRVKNQRTLSVLLFIYS